MILTDEYEFRVMDPKPNMAHTRARMLKFGSSGFEAVRKNDNCHICAVAGDRLLKFGGGENNGIVGGFSHESEHDLAVMVNNFLEYGSVGNESQYSSDSDSSANDLGYLADRVLFHKQAVNQHEIELASIVRSILLSLTENELLNIKNEVQCHVSFILQLIAKHLKASGYDAAVCLSKWDGIGKVPGGDHEYIDVIFSGNNANTDRVIIDLDFRSHFEIARAIDSYNIVLYSLPVIYVGSLPKLKKFLSIMVDAAKFSLKQNSMPLPPWRSLAYLQSKWESKRERIVNFEKQESKEGVVSSDHSKCIGQLKRLKASLLAETESERLLKPITNDKNLKFKRQR